MEQHLSRCVTRPEIVKAFFVYEIEIRFQLRSLTIEREWSGVNESGEKVSNCGASLLWAADELGCEKWKCQLMMSRDGVSLAGAPLRWTSYHVRKRTV